MPPDLEKGVAFLNVVLEMSAADGLTNEEMRRVGFSLLVGACLRDRVDPNVAFAMFMRAADAAIQQHAPAHAARSTTLH